MSTTTQEYYRAFQQAVAEVFDFLEKDFGYHLQQDGEWIFYAVTTHSVITIWLERGAPLNPEVKFQRDGNSWPIGVGGLAKYYDRNWRPIDLEWVSPQDIRTILERAAYILRHYCTPLLKGDFSDWSKIQEWYRQIAIRGAEEREKRAKIGVDADRAFEAGEYAQAVALYEKLDEFALPVLPDEKRRLEEAKRILGLQSKSDS